MREKTNMGKPKAKEPAEEAPKTKMIPQKNISQIKNKIVRTEAFMKMKKEQAKAKKAEKKRRKAEYEALGDKAPPKEVPKTIENQRVKDETMITEEDEEVLQDEATDELASYFRRESSPKLLLTTTDTPSRSTRRLLHELAECIPNTQIVVRPGVPLKKLTRLATERGFTDILVFNTDRSKPNALIVSHLPDGPTAHFRMSALKFRKELRKPSEPTEHMPEVILNNFGTRLGRSVARMFATLFPHDPQFAGRQVVTFHNQRDFIFFRHHRYHFRNNKRCGLQELGPRFTLKLRTLQKGTFNSRFGEYIYVHKRREMETSRRKFML